jgi:hypothetical protein
MRTPCEIRAPLLVPKCCSQWKSHPEMRTPLNSYSAISQVNTAAYKIIFPPQSWLQKKLHQHFLSVTDLVDFTDEEGYGKYLDLHECYIRYFNLKGVEVSTRSSVMFCDQFEANCFLLTIKGIFRADHIPGVSFGHSGFFHHQKLNSYWIARKIREFRGRIYIERWKKAGRKKCGYEGRRKMIE